MTNVKPVKHVHHFWLDHLEVYGTFLDESRFLGMDFENSNQSFFEDFSCTKVENPKFEYQILFSRNNITLFSYFKGKKLKSNIKTKDYVAIYSSCFRVLGIEWVTNILLSYFHIQERNNLRRFDICFDFNIPIEIILSRFQKVEQRGSDFYGSQWEVQTRYIWEKKISKNKRNLIRIYNKKVDILSKWKNELYQDYLLEDSITRIELEIRRELAQNYTFEELLIWENLMWIMKNYLAKHTTIFHELNVSKISLYRKPKNVDFWIIQTNHSWLLRVRIFLWHARWLLERWLDPIYALLDKQIIHPTTLEVLNKSGNFIEVMRMIKNRERNWKEILDAIKDNQNEDFFQ